MRRLFILLNFILSFQVIKGQESNFNFSAYVDAYYAYDFNEPDFQQKQYVTQAARHNEFNINLALIKVAYEADKFRGNLALQTGTYPSINYAEPTELAQMINEANVGIRIGEKSWIDAGVLGGHFGYESVFSLDNELYTQALATEYTPYFQTGIQFSTELNESLSFRAVVLNGWQNIYETNDAKSFGMAVDYVVNENISFSYGNYFGNEGDDLSGVKFRIHNNAYVSYAKDKISSTAVIDITSQERFNSQDNGTVLFLTWVNKMTLSELWSVGARFEYVSDRDQILFTTLAPEFQTSSITASLNYSPLPNVAFKVEGRLFIGSEEIWRSANKIADNTFMFNTGLAIRIE